jgi:hypothetical protein
MAQLSKKAYPGFEQLAGEDFYACFERQRKILDALEATAAAQPDTQVLGGIVKFPVADGYAMYLVIKEKPLTLQSLPFGDGYQADPALIRGLRTVDIEARIKREQAFSRLVPASKPKRA